MAKPYQEGKGWAVRMRVSGHEIYLSGFSSEAKARKAANAKLQEIESNGKPAGMGPMRTSLAQALQDYGRARLPFLKGAAQEANRINRYLRVVGLDTFKLKRTAVCPPEEGCEPVYWSVELVPPAPIRDIPASLRAHRSDQVSRTTKTDALRAQLARTPFHDVRRYHVQTLITEMVAESYTVRVKGKNKVENFKSYRAATIHQERALLRGLFNFAANVWYWAQPGGNPASNLKMPEIDNKRSRVLSNREWRMLSAALNEYGNPYVLPALLLLLETTMRSSEPLLHAAWEDLDFERCMLKLKDAKAGKREVPLSPGAMEVLRALQQRRHTDSTDRRILPLTYEALKKAWNVARKKVGLEDVEIHDLRHTGTTRYALLFNGNMPLLKLITGHKTDSQLLRYINIKPDDVVRMMHGRSLDEWAAPAGMTAAEVAQIVRSQVNTANLNPFNPHTPTLPRNVIPVDFGRKTA